jgi:hypothetical protein
MRSGKSLLVLAVLFGGLLAYLYFVDADRPLTPAGEQRDKVFAGVESSKIQELQVTGSAGETAALRRDGDDWRLTAPVEGRADDSEVSGITSNLESLEIQAVVDEEPTDLEQYGLQEPRVRVAFKADGDTTERRLLLGIRTPTGGDLYARSDDATRVFLVPAYLETSLTRRPSTCATRPSCDSSATRWIAWKSRTGRNASRSRRPTATGASSRPCRPRRIRAPSRASSRASSRPRCARLRRRTRRTSGPTAS